MINLLSQQSRRELAAARRNIILRQYIFATLLLCIGVTGVFVVGYVLLYNQANAYRQDAARYAPMRESYGDVIKEASDYSKNLATAKAIFDNEFIFSDLLTTLAHTLPKNTILSGINIRTVELSKPIELTCNTKSYSDAEALKKAFQGSRFFKDTKLRSITKMPEGAYPYTVALITTLDKTAYMKAQREGTLIP